MKINCKNCVGKILFPEDAVVGDCVLFLCRRCLKIRNYRQAMDILNYKMVKP